MNYRTVILKDFIEPTEKYNIVKMYRDSVCMADDMQAPNNLSFRCYSTDTADLLQEVRDKLPYIRNHCIWVVYAADEEKEEWLKIGFIERNENRYSTITEKEKTPYSLRDGVGRIALWCEYYSADSDLHREAEDYDWFLPEAIRSYISTDSHAVLMKARYNRFVLPLEIVQAYCRISYDSKLAKKEFRTSYLFSFFTTHLGVCMEGTLPIALICAVYAHKVGAWAFLLPLVINILLPVLIMIYKYFKGVTLSNKNFPASDGIHYDICRIYDKAVVSIEQIDNRKQYRKRYKTEELIDVIKSRHFIFLLFTKDRIIVFDKSIIYRTGKAMEDTEQYMSWERRVKKTNYVYGWCYIVLFLLSMFLPYLC